MTALAREERVSAFDKSDCSNGPDEYGNWPCDPQVLFGGQEAECQTCGRVAAWPTVAADGYGTTLPGAQA